jgi:glycosyltransferase involved in cell wall biosynthesis
MMAEREFPPWARYRTEIERRRWSKSQEILFSAACQIFTMSEYTRHSVIQDYQITPDKVCTVYAGPHLDKLPSFEKNTNNKIILFAGKNFERKGGKVLLKAFREVKRRIKDAKLIIAGSKPNASGLDVTAKGFVKKEELLHLYEGASILVMPSIYETFGHVFLEAMAYKTPCIGSMNDAMPEIIDNGKSGFVVPQNDHLKLAEKMIYLLEDEDLIKKMGEEGRRRVETIFNWEKVSMSMTRALATCVSEEK